MIPELELSSILFNADIVLFFKTLQPYSVSKAGACADAESVLILSTIFADSLAVKVS